MIRPRGRENAKGRRRSGLFALLLCASLGAPAGGLTQVEALRPEAVPRVDAFVQHPLPRPPVRVLILPFGAPPRQPEAARWAEDAVARALAGHGFSVALSPPDAPPPPATRLSAWARAARREGAALAAGGELRQVRAARSDLPDVFAEPDAGVEVWLEGGADWEFRAVLSLRLVTAEGARLACSADGVYGPVGEAPAAGLLRLADALVRRCLPADAP